MGSLALVAALATILGGSMITSAALEPPVIHETFTLLPCPAKPMTTLDLEGCAEHRIVRSDAAINARVRAIFFLLEGVAVRGRFVRGERAWLTYRRAVCASRADAAGGGTVYPVALADCEADLNDAHLTDLRRFERELRHH